MPCSQAQGAPAAPSPVSRLGSVAKAPATHDGAGRAGGRASAFGRPSGVRAAVAAGAHVNSTRVRGGRSTSHTPARSACPCPLLHQTPSSLGCVPPMGWQHPTVPTKPPHVLPAPVTLAKFDPTCSQAALCPDRARQSGHLVRIPPRLSSAQHFAWATCVPPPCLTLGTLHPLPLRAA